MYLPQNISEFLDNPMGKGSSVIMNRKAIKENLDIRYESLLRKYDDFKYTIYKEADAYFIHFLIPTESRRRNNYDVVVQLSNSDNPAEDFSQESTVKNYHIRLFSNCPSFVYTYAYVFREYDKNIPQLDNKFRDEAIHNNPVTRNPGEIISFEKSTYFACKYIVDHKTLLKKTFLDQNVKGGLADLHKVVRESDRIMLEISKEEARLKREGGNEGYVRIKKRRIDDPVYGAKPIKSAGVDKTSPAKERIKRERKSSKIAPKPKVTARKSSVSKPASKPKHTGKPKVTAVKSSIKKKT